MGKPTETNIGRFTVQMDKNVYKAIKAVVPYLGEYTDGQGVCTYELLNKVLVLGIAEWSKTTLAKKYAINLNKPEFKLAKKLAERTP